MKKLIFSVTLILFLGLGLILSLGQPSVASAKSNSGKKITICHATGSDTNPFVEITISKNGWENGHKDHQNGRDFVVLTGNCPTENVELPGPIPKQIAGASISPEVTRTKSLPQGGANSNLANSMLAAFAIILSSAIIFETAKKFKLAL